MTRRQQHDPTQTIVYYKPGCPFGIRLRVALRLRHAAFRSVRFRDDDAGAAAVRAINGGNEISPTVNVSGTWLTNPSAAAVVRAARQTAKAPL